MSENEKRLKEIVKLTEERVQMMLHKKAEREETQLTLAQMIKRTEFQEVIRPLRHMHHALEPLVAGDDSGEMLDRLY